MTTVMNMDVPIELKYTKDHEWVRVSGTLARVGITDYAQDALGDVVFVTLPTVGSAVSIGDSFGEVESTKSVSEIYAPVSGTVTALNTALEDTPDLVNRDPYGEGWLCEIEVSDLFVIGTLLDATSYRALIED